MLVSTPIAPIRSSDADVVVLVLPDDGAVLMPPALAVRSVPGAMKPANSVTFTTRAVSDGCVIVILSPATSALSTRVEKTRVRTPLVAGVQTQWESRAHHAVHQLFVTSASLV